LQGVALQRLLPAGWIVAQIGAAARALAGRVDRHPPLAVAHDADQPALRVGAAAGDACALRYVLRARALLFLRRLCHLQYRVASERCRSGYRWLATPRS